MNKRCPGGERRRRTDRPCEQNLLLAARAAVLGASLTVMPLWSTILARLALGLAAVSDPVAVILLGGPIGRYGPTSRPPVGELVHLDRDGHQPYKQRTSAERLPSTRSARSAR